ncbi:unnamed protein product [Parnassius apollo]|uniref:(apollo) hypothetical protein n=1 Tax=Parnassius apollo TaxID=110799 RepID=A0A8S3WY54_PARAO|nr:unnamed protein product [Parnassius apollo]
MNDENIADALNESVFDYSSDDSDYDLTFKPPELDCHVVAIGANDSDTEITDSDDSDNATESDYPAPSPTLSTDSRAPRSRGRAQSRRPSRGRSLTNPRVITLRGNSENDIQYRATELEKNTNRALMWKLRDYKLNLGTKLIEDNDTESDSESNPDQMKELEPKHKKHKVMIKPVPSKQRRLQKASHMPDYGPKQSRCRNKSCDKKTTSSAKDVKCFVYVSCLTETALQVFMR